MILLSVVIPTHKRPQLLKQLLESLVRQSLPQTDFEVLVIATKNDPAFAVVNERPWPFAVSVQNVLDDPTHGKSASAKRNFGATLAKANWLAFVDDDCLAHPDWLYNAHKLIQRHDYCGIEGYTHIPEPEKKTLTYKGITRLGRPGGYQTCNMFYRKKEFQDVGGFDPQFPFYLEDTDLAWTLLESSGKIGYSSEIIVEHPVPPPEPERLMANALRMIKIPYLYKKHEKTFLDSNMRVLPRAYFLFLIVDLLGITLLFLLGWKAFLLTLFFRLSLTALYLVRLFRKCYWTQIEVLKTYKYTLICPWVSLVQLMRGNWKHRTFLFLR